MYDLYLLHLILHKKEVHKATKSQSIAINHSADIDYKHFVKIYNNFTKEPYSFLAIDTTLPASNPLRFRKIIFLSYKNDSS